MIRCRFCKRPPSEIPEYQQLSMIEGTTPEEFVAAEDSSYDFKTQEFTCTDCEGTVSQFIRAPKGAKFGPETKVGQVVPVKAYGDIIGQAEIEEVTEDGIVVRLLPDKQTRRKSK